MDHRLALIWMLVFWRLLRGNGERRRVEFHHRFKQLAVKRRAARRRLKAKQSLQFTMFLSVAVMYATYTVSWSIWAKERSFMW